MSGLTSGRIRWIVVLVVVALVAVSTWLILWSPVFTAKHVVIVGADQVTPEEVRAAAAIPVGAAMVKLPLTAIAERVESLDAVASAEIEREWPNTVRIKVTERRPVAVTETAQGYGLIGSDGEIYAVVESAPEELPVLTDITGDVAGGVSRNITDSGNESPSSTQALASFTVARSLPRQLRGHVASIDALSSSAVRLTLTNGAVVDWGSPDASIRKADVLLVLLRRHASESAHVNGAGVPQHYDVSVPDAPAWSN